MSIQWIWWIAAALLIGAELLTGTFYLLAIGIAVTLGGVAAWLGAGLQIQFGVAGILGVALTIAAHRWRLGRLSPPRQASLDVGQAVQVETWNANGTARIAYTHDLREIPFDVPSQICITKDNTQLQVDGIRYFQVTGPRHVTT